MDGVMGLKIETKYKPGDSVWIASKTLGERVDCKVCNGECKILYNGGKWTCEECKGLGGRRIPKPHPITIQRIEIISRKSPSCYTVRNNLNDGHIEANLLEEDCYPTREACQAAIKEMEASDE